MKSTRVKLKKIEKLNQKKSYDLQCPVSFCFVLPESGPSHQLPLPNYDRGDVEDHDGDDADDDDVGDDDDDNYDDNGDLDVFV